mmetsp:Transcript_30710/g.46525  ORF Transcript_30710/g.46525 Transcript_30710/m.46525 type:complete len:304 (-) Transcript_30710:116-1027(-)
MKWLILSVIFLQFRAHGFTQIRKALRSVDSRRTNDHLLVCKASQAGLYRDFVEHAWSKLEREGILHRSDIEVPTRLATNEAVAKGMPEGSQVKITVDAKAGKGSIVYGRFALLETLVPERGSITTDGIQVMNLVLFGKPPLPVWGVDFVSLPGGKHLLAMDTQPMVVGSAPLLSEKWKDWHNKHVNGKFEWGGDLPEPAKKFFSSHTLWTRLSGDDSVQRIQTDVMTAFQEHLNLYLESCAELDNEGTLSSCGMSENHLEEYLDYRLQNDPARPMLKSLYGPEWTEQLLEEILFPKKRILEKL